MSGAAERASAPRLSIIVAVREHEASARACLDALAPQLGPGVEVIVVSDSDTPGGPEVPAWARRCIRPGGLVPELWTAGLDAARGELVGLLVSTVVPDPDWVERTLELHAGGAAGVGGPIQPGTGLGAVDWAVYFTRYAAYELPLVEPEQLDVPGDNASYRAGVLGRYRDLYADGFWEPFVHQALRADGHELQVHPERITRFRSGARAGAFGKQRYAHGRHHGAMRSRGLGRPTILVASLTAPAVPLVMALRAARAVFGRRRHRLRFLAVAPLVWWFYCWWAAGELAGRLDVARRTAR
jgi:hypothetical protein